MSTARLKHQAKRVIDELSDAQLRVASEFLAFARTRDLNSATLELLAIPEFEESFARGMRDVKAGRTRPWRKMGRGRHAMYIVELSREAERFLERCDAPTARKLARCFDPSSETREPGTMSSR